MTSNIHLFWLWKVEGKKYNYQKCHQLWKLWYEYEFNSLFYKKFEDWLHFLTCILPDLCGWWHHQRIWKNSHFKNRTAGLVLRRQNLLIILPLKWWIFFGMNFFLTNVILEIQLRFRHITHFKVTVWISVFERYLNM